ncbi:MAG: D-glycero-beta-D-manno-heptose 1,7-bisphosphate 7-phosphatase [Gammaproteobacteria bacterium]|nr:D-glycero-beta-D-manno-heptose 1,7-bisphosphate 7-phosphatase [Gammaproteobacteria bacterium]
MKQRRYVLMDRDGVINVDSESFIKTPDEWRPIEGSLEAVALLNKHDVAVAVITNQSGIARGLFDEATLAGIHSKMHRMLAEKGGEVAAVYYCPHGPDSLCDCRKPKPGLLIQFAEQYQANLEETYFVGDSLRDIQAARAAGAMPLLVLTGKGRQTMNTHPDLNIPVFDNLYGAAEYIIATQ